MAAAGLCGTGNGQAGMLAVSAAGHVSQRSAPQAHTEQTLPGNHCNVLLTQFFWCLNEAVIKCTRRRTVQNKLLYKRVFPALAWCALLWPWMGSHVEHWEELSPLLLLQTKTDLVEYHESLAISTA